MKIAAIVVTFNRLELLKKCILALRSQTYKITEIIVVNNSSTDGTDQWLKLQEDISTITQKNTGSSGGQYSGIKYAYEHGYEYFWCMDDDTLPQNNCLEKMVEAINQYSLQETKPIGWVCSNVLWTNGESHLLNGATILPMHQWAATVLVNKYIKARSCSFVSVCFSRSAVKIAGYPYKEFHIWLDDAEYTRRITNMNYSGLLVLDSIAMHLTKDNNPSSGRYLNRTTKNKYKYGYRNTASLLRTRSSGKKLNFLARLFEILFLTAKDLFVNNKIIFLPWAYYWIIAGMFFRPKIDRPNE